MKTKYLIGLLLIGVTLLIGCTQPQTTAPSTENIDLCNDIQTPSASIYCSTFNDCSLTISGDSRVQYVWTAYGSFGVSGSSSPVEAGEQHSMGIARVADRVNILPVKYSTNTKNIECTNKQITIYHDEFKGSKEVLDDINVEMEAYR